MPLQPEPMRKNNHYTLLSGFIILLLVAGLIGCSDREQDGHHRVLIKVGDRVVTVSQFQQTFEMAVVSYPIEVLKDHRYMEGLQLRLLNQMIDELVILSRADELGLAVSDDEVKTAVAQIKSDYPDDTFEKMLLEQSVSVRKWEAGLKKRLLIEKVVKADIKDFKAVIPYQAPVFYGPEQRASNHAPEEKMQEQVSGEIWKPLTEQEKTPAAAQNPGEPEKDTAASVQAAEMAARSQDVYFEWISDLRERFPISIDDVLWEKLKQE